MNDNQLVAEVVVGDLGFVDNKSGVCLHAAFSTGMEAVGVWPYNGSFD